MAKFDYPDSLDPSFWDKQKATIAKAPKAPKTNLGDVLKELSRRHGAVAWGDFNAAGVSGAKEVRERMDFVLAEIKAKLGKLVDQAAAAESAAADFIKNAGKDFAKEPLAAATKVRDAARQYAAQVDVVGNDALSELKAALARAGEKKGGGASPDAAKAKSMAATYRKLGTVAIANARFKPHVKPSRFMVVEFKKSARLYMGMKYDRSLTQRMMIALNPQDTFVRTHVDPMSKVIWEKGKLTLVSNRIPLRLAQRVSLGTKSLLGRAYKVRMRNDKGEIAEGDDPDAKEVSDKELAAELASLPHDEEADNDKDEVAPDSDSDSSDADQATAKGSAASASSATSARSAEAANHDLEALRASWGSTLNAALGDMKGLADAIVGMYPAGQRPKELKGAVEKLQSCMSELRGDLDAALAKAIAAKTADDRAKKVAAAKTSANKILQFVKRDEVMRSLDDHGIEGVAKVSAAARLSATLTQIDAALH